MKSTLLLFLMLLTSLLFANGDPVEISSTIKKVIVFKDGAQVTRTAEADIANGKTTYKFTDITSDLDPQKIQLRGDGDFTILSINHQLNFFEETDKNETLTKLEEELKEKQQDIEEWNIQIKVMEEEEKLIINNNKKQGKEQDNTLPVDELKSMAAFYRSQIAEIRLSKLELRRKIQGQLQEMKRIQGQINEIKSANQGVETSEIIVVVNAETAVKGAFELQYFVTDAGWKPTYDIRVKDVQNPINLIYKANVFQSTGESWDEVKLTLSTATPKQSGVKPHLQKWNLGFYNPQAYRYPALVLYFFIIPQPRIFLSFFNTNRRSLSLK